MNNQSKNLQNLRESSDAIFQEIFGYKLQSPIVKKGPEEDFHKDSVITMDGSHKVTFNNTKSTITHPLPNYGEWKHIDWSDNNINWLSKAYFNANAVEIKDNKVVSMQGMKEPINYNGPFMGGKFLSGTFEDGVFKGQFGPGSVWKASPVAFIDGTIYEEGTILGQENIDSLNQNKFSFSIIRITPGSKLSIQMQDGTSHEIIVLKRLDDKNSLFKFRVKNGQTGKVVDYPVTWKTLRNLGDGQKSDNQGFINMTVFSNSKIPLLFSDIFKLSFNSPIVKVVVGPSEVESETVIEKEREDTPADLSKKQVSYELSKLPLGIPSIPRQGEGKNTIGSVYFNFPSAVEQSGFNEVVKALEKNWLNAYIKKLKAAFDNGVIKEIPAQYPYLANLMKSGVVAEAPQIKKAAPIQMATPLIDHDTQNAMLGIENFLKYFVGTMVRRVRKTGAEKGLYDVEDTIGKEMIKNQIKSLIGAKKTTGSKTGGAARKIKFAESSDVRSIIKDILSENLKHF